MRYFAELRYDGTPFCGWQRQPGVATVQGALEAALSTLLRAETETVGAGRTDTGVHAAYYVAHFDSATEIDDPQHFVYKLNALLPESVAVHSVVPVADSAHARFSAVGREYLYVIERCKNPFTRNASWQYRGVALDVDAMNRAAAMLPGFDDFTSFAKLNSNNKTNICRITHAGWRVDGDRLMFTIRADRFLRNMVRAIVGTLVDVGRGRLTVDDFRRIVDSRDLSMSSAGAPACGLFLNDVKYPDDIFVRTFRQ